MRSSNLINSGITLVSPFFILISVACVVGPSVTMSSTDVSFQNFVFWDLFEFSVAEIT
jgi:hypothetical protein